MNLYNKDFSDIEEGELKRAQQTKCSGSGALSIRAYTFSPDYLGSTTSTSTSLSQPARFSVSFLQHTFPSLISPSLSVLSFKTRFIYLICSRPIFIWKKTNKTVKSRKISFVCRRRTVVIVRIQRVLHDDGWLGDLKNRVRAA